MHFAIIRMERRKHPALRGPQDLPELAEGGAPAKLAGVPPAAAASVRPKEA
jgi:hypothetical protein